MRLEARGPREPRGSSDTRRAEPSTQSRSREQSLKLGANRLTRRVGVRDRVTTHLGQGQRP